MANVRGRKFNKKMGKGKGMGKSEDWGRTKIGLPSGYKYHLEWQSYKDTD